MNSEMFGFKELNNEHEMISPPLFQSTSLSCAMRICAPVTVGFTVRLPVVEIGGIFLFRMTEGEIGGRSR